MIIICSFKVTMNRKKGACGTDMSEISPHSLSGLPRKKLQGEGANKALAKNCIGKIALASNKEELHRMFECEMF